MAGSRKFGVEHMTRNDLASLTPLAAGITNLPYIMDVDAEEADKLLDL